MGIRSFRENQKKVELWLIFYPILAYFGYVSNIPILYWQTHTFNAIAHIGL